MTRRSPTWLLTTLVILFLFQSTSARASPWTLPKGDVHLSVNFDFQWGNKEWLPDGTFQSFPLNGELLSNTLRLEARYGLTDKFEVGIEGQFKSVSYLSDPVILGLPADLVDLPTARGAVTDFSASEVGAGDVLLSARYNLHRSALLVTNEIRLKLPTGYKPPAGTVNPTTGEVEDDVTLGDGQTDIEDSILLGLYVPQIRSFFRAQAGFRWRFGGPAPQAIGGLKAGTFMGDYILVYAGGGVAYSLGEGDIIGKTVVATEDNLQAADVVPGENIVEVDLPWSRDYVQIEAGVLFVLSGDAELFFDYTQIVWGRNITAMKGVNVGVAMKIPEFGMTEE